MVKDFHATCSAVMQALIYGLQFTEETALWKNTYEEEMSLL